MVRGVGGHSGKEGDLPGSWLKTCGCGCANRSVGRGHPTGNVTSALGSCPGARVSAPMGGRQSVPCEDPGRVPLLLLRVAQEHPAGGRDGGQAERGHRGPAEGGPVDDEDDGDEQAAEGRPAHHVTSGVVMGVPRGLHGRVKRRGWHVDGLRRLSGRLSGLDGVNRMTGHGVLPAGSSWTVGLVSNGGRRGSVTARTGGTYPVGCPSSLAVGGSGHCQGGAAAACSLGRSPGAASPVQHRSVAVPWWVWAWEDASRTELSHTELSFSGIVPPESSLPPTGAPPVCPFP